MSIDQTTRRHFLNKLGLAAGGMATISILPAETATQDIGSGKNTIRSQVPRVVMLSLDGICVEGFNKARTPHLDILMKQGSFSMDTRVVMPSVTLPNWTSHLTGSGPEQHGVFNNGWQFDKATYPAVGKDKDGYYPSVFQVLKTELPSCKTAFYYNWGPLVYPYNKEYLDEVEFLQNDEYIPNYKKAIEFLRKNRNSPAVVFLYSVHTDHAGHQYKWMSDEYIRSIEDADEQIGEFLKELHREGLYKDTHFMFLSDHGGIGSGHGGTSAAEMIVPWGIAGPGIKKDFTITEPNNTVNTAPLILHLFGLEPPSEWTGKIIESIFSK